MQTFRETDKILNEDDGSSSETSDEDDNRSASIKRRHRRELAQAERENREHTSALLELRDMEDELNTMRNLFAEQAATIETMRGRYETPEMHDLTENGRYYLGEALERLDDYRRQTSDMIDRVDTTRKDVSVRSPYSFLTNASVLSRNQAHTDMVQLRNSTKSSLRWYNGRHR